MTGTGRGTAPEVVCLVGPSGTGKSHRASVVAHEVGAGAILDDGLLVVEGRIVAGRSAKRETTHLAATRCALLEDPEHAAEIRRALEHLAPERVLVIGISEDMVRRVAANLGLPAPQRIMAIEEFASPRQMRKARRLRLSQGTHVVPAPTLEVRKSFTGYPVSPLRVFVRGERGRGEGSRGDVGRSERGRRGRTGDSPTGRFVEKSVVRPTWSSLGRLSIEEAALAAIAVRAAVDTGQVARVHQVRVHAEGPDVSFELGVAVRYGAYLPGVASAVERKVREVVEHMTTLNCTRVAVSFVAVVPPPRAGTREPPSGGRESGGGA